MTPRRGSGRPLQTSPFTRRATTAPRAGRGGPLRRIGRIRLKRVYEPASPTDGTRVLIMRLWPRGVRKASIDRWLRDLGPVLPLLRAFRAGRVGWSEYRRRYLAGLGRPEAQAQVAEVSTLARRGRVTLLCGCPDERRCHRSLLARYLDQRLV